MVSFWLPEFSIESLSPADFASLFIRADNSPSVLPQASFVSINETCSETLLNTAWTANVAFAFLICAVFCAHLPLSDEYDNHWGSQTIENTPNAITAEITKTGAVALLAGCLIIKAGVIYIPGKCFILSFPPLLI
jgi:hypothetical protein